MMQKTTFNFEVVINDDASTDNTAAIIKQYESKYPEIIIPIYQKENQYSKKEGIWRTILFPRARGKYIAICEGDDYWTDPLKLQAQVAFLETHNDYILVCGGFQAILPTGETRDEIIRSIVPPDQEDDQGFTFTLRDLNKTWFTKTLTSLFRNIPELKSYNSKYNYSRDIHLFHSLLTAGHGYYLKKVLGVYNMHEGGIFSLKSRQEKIITHYYIYKDMYEKSPDSYTRKEYLGLSQELLNYKISRRIRNKEIKTKILVMTIIRLAKSKYEIIYSLKCLVPMQVKRLFARDIT